MFYFLNLITLKPVLKPHLFKNYKLNPFSLMKYFITEFLWNFIISEIIIYFITEFRTIDFERNSI